MTLLHFRYIQSCILINWCFAMSGEFRLDNSRWNSRHSNKSRTVGISHEKYNAPEFKLPFSRIPMPRIKTNDMRRYVQEAEQIVHQRIDVTESKIFKNGVLQLPGTPAWFAAASAKTKVIAKNYSNVALLSEETTKLIVQKYRLSRDQITHGIPTMDIRGTLLYTKCPITVDFPCQPGKYRSYSGHCNNVQNPLWGNANTRYLRYLPPNYADAISVPRQSITGDYLPSARKISLEVHTESDRSHPHVTAILTIFGEFVYHDISHTSQSAGYGGHRIKCCQVQLEYFHPECYPIPIPVIDSKTGSTKHECMDYVRSSPVPRTGCTLGPREQINQVTSYLDGSVIYGSSQRESRFLRTFDRGKLRTQKSSLGSELLPPEEDYFDCMNNERQKCFVSGDVRVNENVGLMVMHTIWMREHNRIAHNLADLNPHWNDDHLFEESRRIVGAEIQHITYNELLPSILGIETMKEYDLEVLNSGYYLDYDINIEAGVANSVATAVLPFLLSMMPSKFDLYTTEYKKVGSTPMRKTYYQPTDMYNINRVTEYMLGLISQNAQNMDEFVSDEMTNNIFFDSKSGFGLDMVAMTIQQGRDHGIPGYLEWRRFCNLKPHITNMNDLRSVMSNKTVLRLAQIYNNVADIDLYTGGLAEIPLRGAMVGPTFSCLLGRQFHALRRGDRFWYENDIPPSSFSREQLAELRKVTLARILCDNGDTKLGFIQPSTMYLTDNFLNAFQTCNSEDISSVDLTKWKSSSPPFMVSNTLLKTSLVSAVRLMNDLKVAESETFANHIGIAEAKSPQVMHWGFLRPKRQARLISNHSLILELASKGFMKVFKDQSIQRDKEEQRGLSNDINKLVSELPSIDVTELIDIPRVFECDEQTLPCDHTTKFRTITGWCNNLRHPEFGKSTKIFRRLLPPLYDDGISSPRTRGKSGSFLPSPRYISTNVHYDISAPHLRYSLMLMQWGQFLDHDLTFTPMNEGIGGVVLNCKDCNSSKKVHPECWPIPVPKKDPYYPAVDNKTGEPTCISFARSLSGQLTLGRREQMNQVTSFLDASNIYGSEICEAKMLRSFIEGRLNVTRHPKGKKDFLPQTATHPECRSPSGVCFEGGDLRASEQPALTSMHTIFLREHNRIVKALARVNIHWDDEQLYQNGRRILSAVLQHITYNEFLPRLLGRKAVKKYDLELINDGYYDGYDPECDATIHNEFSSAAFRLGHTLLRPMFERVEKGYLTMTSPIRLRSAFFNPDILYEDDTIDNILRGLLTSSIETFDNAITEEVTNHLFEDNKVPFSGMDLASLNLQRGRDHGVPPYVHYRRICNMSAVGNFDDLVDNIPIHIINRLKHVYENVEDIDLFTGGLVETPLHGGLVGPTLGCIIGLQFHRLRKCDRFWYETSNSLVRFTEEQLTEIRKVRLSKIVCENSDNIDLVQRNALDLYDNFLNPRIPCEMLPSIDLSKWKESVSCDVGNVEIEIGKAGRVSPCIMCTCSKEGPLCQSLKVTNCYKLASTYSKEAILADNVCKVQCTYAFRAFPHINVSGVLGFSENNDEES
ncbi:uncharacterized protein [Centruroides vittatus]|uniref:uncharacterized protein n=1 Tax=Centruroides vittatus TaxID=120091 RepID=UPI00350ED433